MVKHLPAMRETWVLSLGWENPLRRERLLTRVFLPGEFHGQRSLAGHSPWGCKELDMTEQLNTYTGIAIKEKEMRPFAATWNDLEAIYHTKWSETEKDKTHIT